MQRILLTAIVACLFTEMFSQPKHSTKLWGQPVGLNTQWLYKTPNGTLIVATPDTSNVTTLHAFDQSTGNIKWTYTSPQPRLITYVDPIPGLPYLTLRNIPLIIIDPSDGHIIFDAIASGITYVYKYGFLKSGHLWVDGIFGGIRSLSLIEISSMKMLWTRYDYFPDPDGSKLDRVSQFTTRKAFPARLLSAPINDKDNNIIFASGDGLFFNRLYKVKIDDGNVVWKIDVPDPKRDDILKLETDTSYFRLFPTPNRFMFARINWVTACNYDNGQATWKTPLKTHGEPRFIVYDSIAVAVEPILETSTINFTEPYKIKGMINEVEAVASGLFYITKHSVNIIDINDHKELLSIPGKTITANAGDRAYTFSKEDHNLYEINKANATARVINKARIKFKLLDNPDHIEVVKDGIVLYSEQSITHINFDGTAKYLVNFSGLWDEFFDAKPVYAIDAEKGHLFYTDKNAHNVFACDVREIK